MKENRKKQLENKLEEMVKANLMSPFPVYDTEEIEDIKAEIKKLKYDEEPVEFCNGCKSLSTTEDEFGNVWCNACNSLNDVSKLNIYEYKEKYGNIWKYQS